MSTKLSKKQIQEVMRAEYSLMKPVSKEMSPDQIRALYAATQNNPELQGAIKVLIAERNSKAKTNSVLGSEKSALSAKLYKSNSELAQVKRQLEEYQEMFLGIMHDLLDLDKSEIYGVIRVVIDRISKSKNIATKG